MRYTRATAVAIGAFMLVLPSAYMVDAKGSGHEEGDPMIITVPSLGSEPISCAVYFADNMVFAPQWRTGGLVRIEMMIIDMTTFQGDPRLIDEGRIDLTDEYEQLYPEEDYPEYWALDEEGVSYWSQQLFLLDESDRLSLTSMVSVSYICVTITEEVPETPSRGNPYTQSFQAGWKDTYPYERVIFSEPGLSELGREVNKHGNLIYGMLWDTTGAPIGDYRVDVQLGKVVEDSEGNYVGKIGGDYADPPWYTVDFAVGHLYIGDGKLLDDDRPYVSLVPSEDEDQKITIEDENGEEVELLLYADLGIGLGGVSVVKDVNNAWVLLGKLMDTGPGGGNGGDSGGPGKSQYRGENPHV
jgi:hypothetical protein